MEIQQESNEKQNQHPVNTVITEESEDIINEIINGNFRENVDYLQKLTLLKSESEENEDSEEINSSMLAYAYQVLGQHYMNEGDAEKAATSYFRSLKNYPFNDELTYYLNRIGVTNLASKSNIFNSLNKIVKK